MSAPPFPDFSADLPSGGSMPLLGFGTWRLRDEAAHDAVLAALGAGYRHVDTAAMYANETEVGRALVDSGLSRDDLFVTTKLQPDRRGHERAGLSQSLAMLGLAQVDLWLIHWPPGDSRAMWREFLAARDEGLARDVGVSNFALQQLDELADATGVMPSVNQIPWSPLLFDEQVLHGHRDRGVVLEGYSGLRGGALTHPVILDVAQELGRTPAQVIIRWHLQHGVGVIPKSASPERIEQNCDVSGFALEAEQMAALDALGSR